MFYFSERKARKVSGSNSLVLTLPRAWCVAHKLKQDSDMTAFGTDVLIVFPSKYDKNMEPIVEKINKLLKSEE